VSSADTAAGADTAQADVSGPRPDMSVVVASVNGLPYPLACLEALAKQEGGLTSEVIVADCTGRATVAAIRERFPDVRILAFDEQKSVPWLRAAGIRAATGRLVAVTEDHCVPHADWYRRIDDAHRKYGWAGVGGGVENGSVDRLVDWAVFFCEYSQHMAPVPEGPSQFIPGMNVAYDMDALGPLRELFAEGLWENFLHDHLREGGFVLGMDPKVLVSHQKYFTVPMFLSERFNYSRSFAGMRVKDAPWKSRLAWAAATPLLPPLLIARITRNVVKRRRHLSWFVRALPLILVFSVMWAIGELVGYLTGPGDSLLKVR